MIHLICECLVCRQELSAKKQKFILFLHIEYHNASCILMSTFHHSKRELPYICIGQLPYSLPQYSNCHANRPICLSNAFKALFCNQTTGILHPSPNDGGKQQIIQKHHGFFSSYAAVKNVKQTNLFPKMENRMHYPKK